jgi:hypothetical protein
MEKGVFLRSKGNKMNRAYKKLTTRIGIITVLTVFSLSTYNVNGQSIKNGSFENEVGNFTTAGWTEGMNCSSGEETPTAASGNYCLKTNPGQFSSFKLNLTYQPISQAPSNALVSVFGWGKVLSGIDNLADELYIGLAIIDKFNNWDFISSEGTKKEEWDHMFCYSFIDLLPSDTLVVFLDPGLALDSPLDTEILFDNIKIGFDVGINEEDYKPALNLSTFPNPCTESTNIAYINYDNNTVTLSLTDIYGNTIILEQSDSKGSNSFSLDTSNLASGIYIITLNNGSHSISEKLLVK